MDIVQEQTEKRRRIILLSKELHELHAAKRAINECRYHFFRQGTILDVLELEEKDLANELSNLANEVYDFNHGS